MDNENQQIGLSLFPHVLLRTAGRDSGLFPRGSHAICKLVQQLAVMDQAIGIQRGQLCDKLFAIIPTYREDELFQALIQLKRDIFNARSLSKEQHKLLGLLPARIGTAAKRLDGLMEERAGIYAQYQLFYRESLNQFEVDMHHLLDDEDFQCALLLSSEVLLSKLTQKDRKINRASGSGQQKRLFFSLLRYLSRMFFKTSPFSLFTPISALPLKATQQRPFKMMATPGQQTSGVRVNGALFGWLRELLSTQRSLTKYLRLRCNSTARVENGLLRFVRLQDHSESIIQIKYTALLARIMELLQASCTLENLRKSLAIEMEEVNAQQLESYLEQLLANGLILHDWKVEPCSDAWSAQLIAQLRLLPEQTDGSLAMLVFLECLDSVTRLYARGGRNERQYLLQACNTSWKTLLDAFGKPASFYRELQPTFIYEDATTAIRGAVDKQAAGSLVALVEDLAAFLQPLDALQPERERIKAHFEQLMGAKEDFETDLLSFYKLYRQAFPLQGEEDQNTMPDEFSDRHQQRYRTMLDQIRKLPAFKGLQKGQATLHLSVEELLTDRDLQRNVLSRALFIQPFFDQEQQELCGVVNAVFQGMGKGFGRFLYLLNEQVTTDLQAFNARALGDHIGLDLCDRSLFNANRHPALLPNVIGWEGGQHGYRQRQEINVNDLVLRWDQRQREPQLFHRQTGKRVLPFDLSLQALNRRSGLYRFLVHFSSEQGLSFRPFALALDETLEALSDTKDIQVKLLPRIVYGRRLVIRRRAWLVLVETLPTRRHGEGDDALFLRYRQFFDAWEMPQRLFLKVKPRKAGASLGDQYKPQFLDTYLPPFVLLLERLLPKADKHVYFEEMLPDVGEGKAQRVAELLIQWYN